MVLKKQQRIDFGHLSVWPVQPSWLSNRDLDIWQSNDSPLAIGGLAESLFVKPKKKPSPEPLHDGHGAVKFVNNRFFVVYIRRIYVRVYHIRHSQSNAEQSDLKSVRKQITTRVQAYRRLLS